MIRQTRHIKSVIDTQQINQVHHSILPTPRQPTYIQRPIPPTRSHHPSKPSSPPKHITTLHLRDTPSPPKLLPLTHLLNRRHTIPQPNKPTQLPPLPPQSLLTPFLPSNPLQERIIPAHASGVPVRPEAAWRVWARTLVVVCGQAVELRFREQMVV